MKMEQTECSETSAYKIQTPGNYPKENIQHAEHDEGLKSWGAILGLKYANGKLYQMTVEIPHRQAGAEFRTYLPMKMEQTECSETSAYKIQSPGNYPKENMQFLKIFKKFLSAYAIWDNSKFVIRKSIT